MSKIIGVNKRCYPSEIHYSGYAEITTVLVEGEVGDYAAYSGQGTPEYVANLGDKISFTEACCHFPYGLKKEKYRD